MFRTWQHMWRAGCAVWSLLNSSGARGMNSSSESLQQAPKPSEAAPQSSRGCVKPGSGLPVSPVMVLGALSRATIPVPASVVAHAIDGQTDDVLLALLELEAAGVVTSRAMWPAGVLYHLTQEEEWRRTW